MNESHYTAWITRKTINKERGLCLPRLGIDVDPDPSVEDKIKKDDNLQGAGPAHSQNGGCG